jgi:hypothetical protein
MIARRTNKMKPLNPSRRDDLLAWRSGARRTDPSGQQNLIAPD